MARKTSRKVNPPLDDSENRYSSARPSPAVYRTWKPKKGVSLVADEWERRLGWRDTANPRMVAKPYGGSLGRGGSGDPYARERKAAKRKPLY